LDALVAKSACGEQRVADGKGMLLRVVSMLTKLVELYEQNSRVREDGVVYSGSQVSLRVEDENEDDDEDEDD
jgi:hypothetical protein